MEKTLIISFENSNSNQTDWAVEIPVTENNLEFFNDFSETTKTEYITYLEAKGFVEGTTNRIIDGSEYKVWDRPKIAR